MTSSWDSATGRLSNAAVWYASQGWKILPCYGIIGGRCNCNSPHAEPKDVGKHPSIPEWNTRATSDLETISAWYEQSPENNIGVHCQASSFFVIDIDPRSDGPASFEKFESLLDGALPKTVEAITGEYSYNGKVSRGRHLFYKCDDNEALVGNLKKSGLPGIDIKHNGYVLIAPSRHFSGNCYEWVPGRAPWEIEMAEAPEELLSVLRKRARKSGTNLGEAEWEWLDGLEFGGQRVDVDRLLQEGIEEGSRAVDIYSMTCALANKFPVHTDAGKLAVETMMIRFNAEKVRPPLPLEGQGSLLMHVRRAIDFVINNPKTERLWPGLQEWAQKSQEETNASAKPQSAPSTVPSANTRITAYEHSHLPGTVGGTVDAGVRDGDSVRNASNLSNIDVPKDPDAIGENEGGEPGKRTLSDTGNGRRLVDSFGPAVRYTPGLGWFHWDGGYWKPDIENLEMRELSKKLAPIIASEIVNYDEISSLQSVKLKHMEVIYNKEKDVLIYDRKLKDGPGNSMYGLEVCKSLSLPQDFLDAAYEIRMKYYPESKSILSLKTSQYNSKKIVNICEKCEKNPGKEVHHLQYQKDANNEGIIYNCDGVFHKNNLANLITLCENCHNEIHRKDTKLKKVKTTKGTQLKEI